MALSKNAQVCALSAKCAKAVRYAKGGRIGDAQVLLGEVQRGLHRIGGDEALAYEVDHAWDVVEASVQLHFFC